jgi:S1-C subfamily serine protease
MPFLRARVVGIGLLLGCLFGAGATVALRAEGQAAQAKSVVYCPVCGAENKAGSKFCLKDGAPLPAYEPARQPQVFTRSPATYSDEEVQQVLNQAAAAVVRIRAKTTTTYKYPRAYWKTEEDEYFAHAMVGEIETSDKDQRLAGSGFAISADGEIVTNAHVAYPDRQDAELTVEAQDGSTHAAKLVGADPASDIALIKIDPSVLPPLEWGDSGSVRVGQQTWAIGNPLDIGISFTRGTMSGVNASRIGLHQIEAFMHSDAKITHGNSGGPLVDVTGHVLGINAITFGEKGQGYSIPSKMARLVVDRLRKDGKYERGFAGLQVKPIDADAISLYNLVRREGTVVESVLPGTPAEQSGIKPGDVIYGINGHVAGSTYLLQEAIASVGRGSAVTLTLDRRGQKVDASITTTLRPDSPRGDPLRYLSDYLRLYFEEDAKQHIVIVRDPNRSRRAPGIYDRARVRSVLAAQDWPEEPITLNYYRTRAKPVEINTLQDLRKALARMYVGGRVGVTFEIDNPSAPIASVAFDEVWPIFI